jgi:hypothetical protein
MLVVLGSYQNDQIGVGSNQLTDAGKVGECLGG